MVNNGRAIVSLLFFRVLRVSFRSRLYSFSQDEVRDRDSPRIFRALFCSDGAGSHLPNLLLGSSSVVQGHRFRLIVFPRRSGLRRHNLYVLRQIAGDFLCGSVSLRQRLLQWVIGIVLQFRRRFRFNLPQLVVLVCVVLGGLQWQDMFRGE